MTDEAQCDATVHKINRIISPPLTARPEEALRCRASSDLSKSQCCRQHLDTDIRRTTILTSYCIGLLALHDLLLSAASVLCVMLTVDSIQSNIAPRLLPSHL